MFWIVAASGGARARDARGDEDGAGDARGTFGRVVMDARDRAFRDASDGGRVRAIGANVCAWTTRGRRDETRRDETRRDEIEREFED